MRYVNPTGTAVFTLLAGELLVLAATGNNPAIVSVYTGPTSNPGGFIQAATVKNASAEIGPYNNDRQVMIEASDCSVVYETGEAPVLTTGVGLVVQLPGGAVLMTNDGVPDADVGVGIAGPGSLCIDYDTPTLYVNEGDATTPDWTALAFVTP